MHRILTSRTKQVLFMIHSIQVRSVSAETGIVTSILVNNHNSTIDNRQIISYLNLYQLRIDPASPINPVSKLFIPDIV